MSTRAKFKFAIRRLETLLERNKDFLREEGPLLHGLCRFDSISARLYELLEELSPCRSKEIDEVRIRIIIGLAKFLTIRLPPGERIGWYESAIQSAQRRNDQRSRCRLLDLLATTYVVNGNLDGAYRFFRRALNLQALLKENESISLATNYGNLLTLMGRITSALSVLEPTLEAAKTCKQMNLSRIQYSIGFAYMRAREYCRALEHFRLARESAHQSGDILSEADSLGNLGTLYRRIEDYENSERFHLERLQLAEKIGDRRGQRNSCGSLGNTYFDMGRLDEALTYHRKSLELSIEFDDMRSAGQTFANIGNVYQERGDFQSAIEFMEKAAYTLRGHQSGVYDAISLGVTTKNLAFCLAEMGDFLRATRTISEAIEQFSKIDSESWRLEDLHVQLNKWELAMVRI